MSDLGAMVRRMRGKTFVLMALTALAVVVGYDYYKQRKAS